MTFWFSSINRRRASKASEVCYRETATREVVDKCKEVYIYEARASVFGFFLSQDMG